MWLVAMVILHILCAPIVSKPIQKESVNGADAAFSSSLQ